MEESEKYALVLEKNLKLLEQNIALSEQVIKSKEEAVKSESKAETFKAGHLFLHKELRIKESEAGTLMSTLQKIVNAFVDAKKHTKTGLGSSKPNAITLINLTDKLTEILKTYQETSRHGKEKSN